jgi:hypothetical protein
LVDVVRKRGLVVVVSDFLAEVGALEQAMIRLAACGHEVVVFQVLDPSEVDFQFREPAIFEDSESGRELMLDPAVIRADYQQRLEEHCQAVRRICVNLGNTYLRLKTDVPLELALFDFLRARAQAARRVRRAGAYG